MKNDQEELFFKMAALAHLEQESELIETEIALLQEKQPTPCTSVSNLEMALSALKKQQNVSQNAIRHKHMVRMVAKAAAIVLVLGISSALLITNVDALRVAVFNFFSEQYEQYTTVRLEPENIANPMEPTDIPWEDAYTITALPSGYQLMQAEQVGNGIRMLTFTNGILEDNIELDQCLPGGTMNVNTEGVPIHKITIQGFEGFWVQQQQDTIVVWNNRQYVFLLILPKHIENFVEIAESVKKVK